MAEGDAGEHPTDDLREADAIRIRPTNRKTNRRIDLGYLVARALHWVVPILTFSDDGNGLLGWQLPPSAARITTM